MSDARETMLGEALESLLESMPESSSEGGALDPASPPAQAMLLLRTYLTNIARAPEQDKYRSIRADNTAFKSKLGRYAAARQLLRMIGFVDSALPAGAGSDAPSRAWVLPAHAELTGLHAMLALLEKRCVPLPPVPGHAAIGTAPAGNTAAARAYPPTGAAEGSGVTVPRTKAELRVEALRQQKLAVRDDVQATGGE